MRDWQVVAPSGKRWDRQDPTDPDLILIYTVPENAELRLQVRWPIAWAQRLLKKAPLMHLTPSAEGVQLEVTLGLTAIHRLFGAQLDLWLSALIQVEQRPTRMPAEALSFSAFSPIQVSLPSRYILAGEAAKNVRK